MGCILSYIHSSIDYVDKYNLAHSDDKINIIILTKYFETKTLSNLLGLAILFRHQDWFETIVKAVDSDQEKREKALDNLIAMKIANYPIYCRKNTTRTKLS